jgi:LysM repeat protein
MTTPPQHPTDSWRDTDVAPGDSEVTRDFWGAGDDWSSSVRSPAATTEEHRGLAATVGRWWNSTGSIPATRVHGRPSSEIPVQPVAADDDTDELELDDWLVDAWSDESPDQHSFAAPQSDLDPSVDLVGATGEDDQESTVVDPWNVPAPVAARPMIDPLLARLGAIAILVTLLVPAVLGFVSDSDEGDALRIAAQPSTADPALASTDGAATGTETVATAPTAADSIAADSTLESTATPVQTAAPTSSAAAATTDLTAEPVAEQLTVDACSTDYEVVAGDFWIRIADGSGAPLADLLAVNDATISTPLYPGSTICLPAGATTPPAPTSPATSSGSSGQGSPTTAAPAPTPPPATSPPSTAAPTTTRPPLPPASNASAAEVQAIIRSVWPDELEERALEIARRESNFIPTAKNFCCYGVFQIYWSVHRSWLSGIGVTSAEQLYDPTTNARAALALYERSGGWGPWGG